MFTASSFKCTQKCLWMTNTRNERNDRKKREEKKEHKCVYYTISYYTNWLRFGEVKATQYAPSINRTILCSQIETERSDKSEYK